MELLTGFGGGEDWDEASAYEALARAHAVAGDQNERNHWIARAREALQDLPDADERGAIEEDLRTIR